MLELSILLVAVAAFTAGSFNPVTIFRKFMAWANWGIGASPKALETTKLKFAEYKAASDLELRQQGEDVKRIRTIYQAKGAQDMKQMCDPIIEASKKATQESLDKLNSLV